MTATEAQPKSKPLIEGDRQNLDNEMQSKKSGCSYKTLDFLNKDNDYDDVDLNNSVVYEVEESNGKIVSPFLIESKSEYDSEEEQGVIQLEVNLDNGKVAKLIIMNEEMFEEDIRKFCE